jgi:hypothetical protein
METESVQANLISNRFSGGMQAGSYGFDLWGTMKPIREPQRKTDSEKTHGKEEHMDKTKQETGQYDPQEHFTSDGEGLTIEPDPQCVGCVHNEGFDQCAAMGKKLPAYADDTEVCPFLTK